MVWFPIPCLRGSHFPKILIPSSVVLMTPAVKESVCQWCGARIYLVRVSINNWEWATDLKQPRANLEMLCRCGMASGAFASAGLVRQGRGQLILEIDIGVSVANRQLFGAELFKT